MWSTSEFEAQLRAVGERRYHHLHPFQVRMHAGGLSKEEFQDWVVNRFYYQVSIPVKDSHPRQTPEPRGPAALIGGSTTTTAARVNPVGSSCGYGSAKVGSRARMESCERAAMVRFAVDAYVALPYPSWLEAVASTMTEFFAPD